MTEECCLYCCLPRHRSGGCQYCGPSASGYSVEPEPGVLPPGTILQDQFLVGRKLKSGGFGVTYLGVDLRLKTRVAIKEYFPQDIATRSHDGLSVLPVSLESDQTYRYGLSKFLEEAVKLAQLPTHQNIVGIRTYVEQNNTAYLIMEYVEGRSLEELQQEQGGRLTEGQVVAVLHALLDALGSIHRSNLLHCDIKPTNIYLTPDNVVKLLDFGASRRATATSSTQLFRIFTPGYAPTEQYTSNGRIGPWTDIYGVGATGYTLLTGEIPPPSVDRALQGEGLKDPREFPSLTVSNSTASAILKALQIKEEDRFQSADEFKQALANASATSIWGSSSQPPGAPSGSRSGKPVHKGRWIAGGALLLVLCALILFLPYCINKQTVEEMPVSSCENCRGEGEISAKMRVCPGKSWDYKEQNDNRPGTVRFVDQSGHVWVHWDNGHEGKYRWGFRNARDLVIISPVDISNLKTGAKLRVRTDAEAPEKDGPGIDRLRDQVVEVESVRAQTISVRQHKGQPSVTLEPDDVEYVTSCQATEEPVAPDPLPEPPPPPSPPPPSQPTRPSATCTHVAAVYMVLLDASGSLSNRDFRQEGEAASDLAYHLHQRATRNPGEMADWLQIAYFGGHKRYVSLTQAMSDVEPGLRTTEGFVNCSYTLEMGLTQELVKTFRHPRYQRTAIYSAIGYGIVALGNHERIFGTNYVRNIILVTDGQDDGSPGSLRRELRTALEREAARPNPAFNLFVIGVGRARVDSLRPMATRVDRIESFNDLAQALVALTDLFSCG